MGCRCQCSAHREGAPRSSSSRAEAGRVRVGRPPPTPVGPTRRSRCTGSSRGPVPRAGGGSRALSVPCRGRVGPVFVLPERHREGRVTGPVIKRPSPPSQGTAKVGANEDNTLSPQTTSGRTTAGAPGAGCGLPPASEGHPWSPPRARPPRRGPQAVTIPEDPESRRWQ